MDLIHYSDGDKLIVVNLGAVCRFKQGDEVTPLLWVSYNHAPNSFTQLPYKWDDFLKNFYPDKSN